MPANMKGIIADTFLKMVQHKNMDKITVKSLIDECHISRQTFYYHFRDIMDVLEWLVQQMTEQLVKQSLKAEDMRSALQIFISFAVERFPMLQKLMNSQRRSQIEKIMIDAIGTYLEELAKNRQQDIPGNYTDRAVLLRYSACGLVGVLLAYGGKPDLDQDRLAFQLERILSGELSGWNEK